MKKLLALACAASALALTSAAHADTTSLTVNGTVLGYCTINQPTPSTYSLGNISNSNGARIGAKVGIPLTVAANGACQYTLTTTNGGLKGPTGSPLVPYFADVVAGTSTSVSTTPAWSVPGTAAAANTVLNAAGLVIPAVSSNPTTQNVVVEVATTADVSATPTVLSQGTYTDILVVTVTAG